MMVKYSGNTVLDTVDESNSCALTGLLIGQFQLNAVAVATGIGWMLVNLFWSGCYFSSTTWKIINFK